MAFIFNLTVNYIIIWLNECNAIESWLYIIYIYIRFYFSVAFSSRFCCLQNICIYYTMFCYPSTVRIVNISNKSTMDRRKRNERDERGNGGDGDSGWISNSNERPWRSHVFHTTNLPSPSVHFGRGNKNNDTRYYFVSILYFTHIAVTALLLPNNPKRIKYNQSHGFFVCC